MVVPPQLMTALGFFSILSAVVAVVSLVLLGRSRARQQELETGMELQDSHLQDLFEISDDPALLLGPGGRILRGNEGLFQLLGYPPAELELLTLGELVVEDPTWRGRDLERRAVRGELVHGSARLKKADGDYIELSISGGPINLPGQEARSFLVARDLTRQILVDAAFHRLEEAVGTMQLGVTVTDLDGTIVYANPADAVMHGYEPDELVGLDVRVLAPNETHDPLTPARISDLRTWRRDSVNIRLDGTVFPVHLMSDVVRDGEGRPIGIVTTCEDITERKRREDRLIQSEERYALAMRGANDGLWDWDLDRNEIFYSPRWQEIIGDADPDFPRTLGAWMDRVHPDDRDLLWKELEAHREGRTPRFEHEHRIKHNDDSYRWVLARGMAERGADGQAHRFTGSLTDITDRKGNEQQLAYEALYDPLTGLPNRAFLNDLLKRSMRRLRRQKGFTFAVLFLDVDRFKQVNDTLGHATGDKLLVEVSRRLQTCVRPGDVVTRLGGDEFCLLLDDIAHGSDATRVATRILELLGEPVSLEGRTIFTGVSIGIAVSEPATADPETLLRNADTAMYRAKTGGRGRFEVFDRSMHERAVEALRLEADLQEALPKDQLRLVYMPVVRLHDGRVVGLEALLRWSHPERGEISPAVFVPVAEETGAIVPMGWWVLERACVQMAAWSRDHPTMRKLTVSVNLSVKQLRQPDLLDRIAGALELSDLPPERLLLEVNEQALMEEPEWHEEALLGLGKMGVRVQVDDFGTGTSSLSYLGRLKVATLKIDRSVVKLVDQPEEQSAIVRAIITFARNLGIHVIAEGIETPGQRARLQTLECDQGQGFHFSQPLEADTVAEVLSSESQLQKA